MSSSRSRPPTCSKHCPSRCGAPSPVASTGVLSTKKAEDAVIEAIAELRPDAAAILGRGCSVRRPALGPTSASRVSRRQPKRPTPSDWRSTSSAFRRGELGEARPDGLSSFVEVLSDLRTPEDPAIVYDSMRFLTSTASSTPQVSCVFSKGDERLTVINVNRQPLERTTGADLIYVNETTKSFVLVQYKTFRREGEHSSHLVYRPDAQFAAELKRMRKIKVRPPGSTPTLRFRLHPGCCFLKICKPVTSLGYNRAGARLWDVSADRVLRPPR